MGIFRRLSGKKLSPDINIDDDEDSDADPDASRTENPREKNKGRYQQRIMEQQSLPSSEQQEEVDLAPGVFHKKGKQELHMGHKPSPVTSAMPTNAREPSSHPPVVIISGKEPQTLNQPALLPPPPPLSGNGTSSTALWIASADSSSRSPTKNKAAGSPSSKTKAQHKNYQMPESAAADDGDGDDDAFDSDFFEYVEEAETSTALTGDKTFGDIASDDPSFLFLPERKTTIRFDEYDEMQTCLHINDYTKHEIGRSWYRREDYDNMVNLARKTASKAVKREQELREELESMLGRDSSGGAGEKENSQTNNKTKKSDGKQKNKKKKPIEYRGLEAWTPDGAVKVRSLKESSIELVWNEQSRQWEEGTFDPYAIMEVYLPISKTAAASARERGANDEDIVKKIIKQEKIRAEKKRNRTVYRKSKDALKTTAKTTASGLVNGTGRIAVKTGKVGMRIGNRAVKAGVATATLDPRMMKEALRIRGKKKRECERKHIITQSRAAHEREVEEEISHSNLSVGKPTASQDDHSNVSNGIENSKINDDLSSATGSVDYGYEETGGSADFSLVSSHGSRTSHSHSESASMGSSLPSPGKKKKSRMKLLGGPELKLLGVVPIPGTKKVYKDERRDQRAVKRVIKMSRRPSWETGVSRGKY